MKGIVPDDILDALKKKKLGLPGIDCEAPEKKNAMMAGEFEVILELLEKYKEGDVGKIAKAQVNISVCPGELVIERRSCCFVSANILSWIDWY